MIVYREFSSLCRDLGFSGQTLYSVSSRIDRHYRPVRLPKTNGEYRQLFVPDDLLKAVQRRINDRLLPLEPVSPYATAYRPGGSTRRNAAPHVGRPVLLKLDIRRFFDSLTYPLVSESAFPKTRYSAQNRTLLTLLCTYKNTLPQGAPTSPAISNIVLCPFDNTLGEWCRQNGIAYTRYCDDMTFSGDFDPKPVIALVRAQLSPMGLFLNDRKTAVIRGGQRQSVTGLVVNERLNVPAAYKRQLRQEMYYCRQYGIANHLARCGRADDVDAYAAELYGRVCYVLSVEPDNADMQTYALWLCRQTEKHS